MSHFSKIKTIITDKEALIKALNDVGFKNVEVSDTAQHLYGFQGDERPQTAEIIIRRKFVGRLSNDIGFKKQEDGTFEAVISDYDTRRFNQVWLDKLSQRYSYHVTKTVLATQGFSILEEKEQENGVIAMTLRRLV